MSCCPVARPCGKCEVPKNCSYTCCPKKIKTTLCLPPRYGPPMPNYAPFWCTSCCPAPRCCSIKCRCLPRLPPCPPAYYACSGARKCACAVSCSGCFC